jgi:cobalt/nickel transport system permease protein
VKTRIATFIGIGLLVALLLAAIVSFYASGSPDGLERVAGDTGFNAAEEEHALGDSPFADYGTSGVDNARLSGGLAGIVGVLATFTVAGGIFYLVKRRNTPP